MVPVQQTCQSALRHYLSVREHERLDDFLVTRKHERLLRRDIMDMLKSYMILLHGGDMYALQTILGHSTLDMVRHYVQLFRSEVHLVSNSAINLSKSKFFIFLPQQNLYLSPPPHGHKS